MNQLYKNILKKFPSNEIKYVIAYGSGVFKQQNNNAPVSVKKSNSSNMIDFVFVVKDSVKFHKANLETNKSHYSFLKYMGAYNLSAIQDDIPSGCYYNTLVPIKLEDSTEQLIKYGVINEKILIRDLYDWDYLYIG